MSPATRELTKAPARFDGALEDLYRAAIEPNLPEPGVITRLHRQILDYCQSPDPVFVVRYVAGTTRREVRRTNAGDRFKASDNSPAWWMHFVAFNNVIEIDFAEMPTHVFDVQRVLRTHISAAGFHVAHILNAKDRNTDWTHWSRDELVRRFVRNVHPCNCFYVPTIGWRRYGGHPGVIAFFAEIYRHRYADVWEEFLSLTGGTQPPPVPAPWYRYPLPEQAAAAHVATRGGSEGNHDATASYRYARFCFKADIIEPLHMDDTFEMITPMGTFRMTKAEFYRDFANVVQSESYQKRRIYHAAKPPARAAKYLVAAEPDHSLNAP